MQFPLPKLIKWLIKRFLVSVILSSLLGLFCFYIFFETYKLSNFIIIFSLGFLFCCFIFILLFFRFLHSLSRVIKKVEDISKGKSSSNIEDPYLDEEPGEFYELNKNLSQINNDLKWQKKIISQESSELEAVISALTEAILAIDQNKKVLFFNNQATLLFSSQRKPYKSEMLLSEMIRNPDILQAYNDCLQKAKVIKKTLSIGVFDTDEEESIYEITVAPLKKTKKQDSWGRGFVL